MTVQIMRPVVNLNTGEVYQSVSAAAKATKFGPDSISDAARNKTKLGGNYWCYQDCIRDSIEKELARYIDREQVVAKYARDREWIDLETGEVFTGIDAVAKAVRLSCAITRRLVNAQRDINGRYFAKKRYADDIGRQNVLAILKESNELSSLKRTNYQTTRGVVNLSTGEQFASITDANKKYPDDYIRNSCNSKNPAKSGSYWMFVDQIDKPIEQHYDECVKHFENIGKNKRRNLPSRAIAVHDLTNNKVYTSISEAQKAIGSINVITKFKKQSYYFNGIVLVPDNVYKTINDINQFVFDVNEQWRTSIKNTTIINTKTLERFSSLDAAARYAGLTQAALKYRMSRPNSEWVREYTIPADQYKEMKLVNIE